ncbi:MAG TPA: condensation domain-containing protein, partial [Acetobacteraceae bacterium]
MSEEHLRGALGALLDHHDALRLRLDVIVADGDWSLEVAPAGAVAAGACLRRVDVGGVGEADWGGLIAAEAAAAERRLDPAAGVMVQAVWFDAGAARPGRLWLAIHHLAVDGVSWRILVPDLASAWQAISMGQAVALAPRGTSFRRWAEALAAHARDGRVTQEVSYWNGELRKPSLLLVDDRLDAGRDSLGSAGHLTLTLPAAVTEALLTRVPSVFHGGIDDVLLTGLSVAVADWCRRRVQGSAAGRGPVDGAGLVGGAGLVHGASHAVLLDLEGHGREEALGREEPLGRDAVFGDIDLTRTVGWFTSLYPVRLDPGLLDLEEALSGGAALGRALKTIKEQLRAVPGKGLGYGLLRYLNGATAAEFAGVPAPQLGFNYLGRFAAGGAGALWAPAEADERAADGARLPSGDPAMPLSHLIEINALTLDGADGSRLSASWTWAAALLGEAEVRDLAETWFRALVALTRYAAQPGAGGRSPSDLALLDLTQGEIERLESHYQVIEDILPLSPLQEGLLFHALYDAAGPDVYTVQLELELEGMLDGAVLQASADAVVNRHASLRAAFRHERLNHPVQVIARRVGVPWRLHDVSELSHGEQELR